MSLSNLKRIRCGVCGTAFLWSGGPRACSSICERTLARRAAMERSEPEPDFERLADEIEAREVVA
jgi:hypothetical protein